ncbi:DUF4397 domain-containing protein [Desulforamulus aeronauticus]|uniref:DUF4397 domain-containing protein n=1 Tax=Desulforamulus aeronauticus DSM 10349 TaxID=1121421 RepID=A0A1M6S6J0_9FIRM|nr:DUF4397 domain-containing protein [Desulforamulus aeronauticus]SHK40311.1 protein of unknown function [Desulforamulus aeronauticus DSM 10349]
MSNIRILNASPDAPAVDVLANDMLLAQNLSYRNFTDYLEVAPGTYNVRVYPAGNRTNPFTTADITIPPQTIATLALVGRLQDLALQLIPDPKESIPPGQLKLRFAHLSPFTANVDVILNNFRLFNNVGYREVTDYLAIDPGTYTLQLKLASSDEVMLTVPNQNLTAGKFFTAYLVGLVGCTPGLQLLLPLDGNTYINPDE